MSSSPPSAFISVSIKNEKLTNLVTHMITCGWDVYCTDGTYTFLMETIKLQQLKTIGNIQQLKKISSITNFNEILGGRVKTLHPVVHGSILKRPDEQQYEDLIDNLQIVVVNLYQNDFDIGGHAIIRSCIKNSDHVLPIVNPDYYGHPAIWAYIAGEKNYIVRSKFVQQAFEYVIKYDINLYRERRYDDAKVFRSYDRGYELKYGCNPHQGNARLLAINDHTLPFTVVNGEPGYINIVDALYGINLVKTLAEKLNCFAAASYKHNSPAGVAVTTTDLNTTYIKARDSDPKSSFGDFIAVSHEVDTATAKTIKNQISDGIIAPYYTDDALDILKTKKQGKFIILKYKNDYKPKNNVEIRELFGVALMQESDNSDASVINCKNLMSDRCRDLILANVTLKYTQSNSVCFAYDGQVIGIAAGQQSRIDCVKLAKMKAETYLLRSHPKVIELNNYFKRDVKKQARTNALIQYIENDFTPASYREWLDLFDDDHSIKAVMMQITSDDKKEWINTFYPVMASDGFIPFRDSIDVASKLNTCAIVQPGGSTRDYEVQRACDDYRIKMIHTGVRLFCH